MQREVEMRSLEFLNDTLESLEVFCRASVTNDEICRFGRESGSMVEEPGKKKMTDYSNPDKR